MNQFIAALASVIIVSLISFIGVLFIKTDEKRLRSIVIFFVSFSAGALFGDAFIHLLPEASESSGFSIQVSALVIFGLVFGLFVEKFIRWQHCHLPEAEGHHHTFASINLLGDVVHNFLDGLIIGASYLVNIQVGIATTVAVILHEIPQEIGDFGVLIHAGFSKQKALLFNFLVSLSAVAGVLLSFALSAYTQGIIELIIPFAAGAFIYIAGSDLIPELNKHEFEFKNSVLQLFFFLLGIGIMALLLLLE